MVEQLIFIMVSVILFCIIFYKVVKKNDTSYVIILAIEAIGIAIDFVATVYNIKLNIYVKIVTYIISIVLPIVIILLENKNINILQWAKFFKVNVCIALKNKRNVNKNNR